MSSNNTANSRDKSEEAESEEAASLAKKALFLLHPMQKKQTIKYPDPFLLLSGTEI